MAKYNNKSKNTFEAGSARSLYLMVGFIVIGGAIGYVTTKNWNAPVSTTA